LVCVLSLNGKDSLPIRESKQEPLWPPFCSYNVYFMLFAYTDPFYLFEFLFIKTTDCSTKEQ
jgi:hypothetical protein